MQIKSGKAVEKPVNNSEQNWWNKNVQKMNKLSFTQKITKSTKVLHNLIDILYTNILFNYSPLFLSFTHYPHRTTITTTYYLIKEEKCR